MSDALSIVGRIGDVALDAVLIYVVYLRRYGNGLAVTSLQTAPSARARGLAAPIEAIRGEGVTSANGIANALNERSIATPRGGKWTARRVLNLVARLS